MRSSLYIAALLCAASPWLARAQQTDVIRGRVTAAPPDTGGLQGVSVRVTSAAGLVTKRTTTDREGRFQLVWINGEGDYWAEFNKIGFASQRRQIKRIGDEEVLILNIRMSSVIATLDPVITTDQRTGVRLLPNRNAADPDVSGNAASLVDATVSPDQLGNLAALAAANAGIQLVPGLDGQPDMYSVLGLGADQNALTFNGIGSGITLLPPEIIGKAALRTISFDPAIGGFSGGQISVSTLPGSNFSRRMVAHTNILPTFQWTNATAAAQSQKFTSLRLGGNAAGPIVMDQAFYNMAYNVNRRFSDARTLLTTPSLGLLAAGVSLDSATRLSNILGRLGVPVSGHGVSPLQMQTTGSAVANFDITPSASGAGDSFLLSMIGNYARSEPVNQGLLSTPAHSATSTRWTGTAGLTHTRYLNFFLSKTVLGFAASRAEASPFLDLPEGRVRVRSPLPDGGTTVRSLAFGGSPAQGHSATNAIQAKNELSWYSGNNTHTLKLTTSGTHSSFSSEDATGTLGQFVFNSLDDLAAGQAASFTRLLTPRTRSATQLSLAASLGDYWRPTNGLQIQFGGRVDAVRFLSTPGFNPAVATTFGQRNDHVPSDVNFSPRFGLQWGYGKTRTVGYAPGAARPPRAIVHAGVGVFQNVSGPQLIGNALMETGLPNAVQRLTCVGGAVPFADWNAFLTSRDLVPSACVDGPPGDVFATTSPSVTLFDPSFRQPRSIRALADWAGTVLDNRFMLGLQTIWSWGRAQNGQVDVNLDPTPRFQLSNEADRPVFVTPSAIVPLTGAIAPGESRVSTEFQRVWTQRSDLRADSRLFSLSLEPVLAPRYFKWALNYTWLDVDETFFGFASATRNPFDISHGPALSPRRHGLSLSWRTLPVFDVAFLTTVVRLTSGARYTPRIAGDVNGDGLSNDNAFIFDPARSSDTAMATAMRNLLSGAPGSARECLSQQLGQLATRGSCQGPWTAAMSLGLQFNPVRLSLPKRVTVSMNVQNPLALADIALHGRNGVHGWGQAIPPDPTLLYVRGFDPVTNQFKYDVNQRFGSTRPQQSVAQQLPYLSLGVRIDIGTPRERQLLTQRLDAGRTRPGGIANDGSIRTLGIASIPNPMLLVLQQADSLGLTRQQADSLASLGRQFAVYGDSIWTEAARALARLPVKYDQDGAFHQFVQAREKTIDYVITLVDDVKGMLTASQRRRLPLQIMNYLDERVLRFLRSSSSGDISGLLR